MGMSDNVTLALGASGYNVHKLVLFGSFGDVMPWMLRFGLNKCVLAYEHKHNIVERITMHT